MPDGALPSSVVGVINTLPYAQAAALIRQPFTDSTLQSLSSNSQVHDMLGNFYGITPHIAGHTLSTMALVGILAAVGTLCLIGGIANISRRLR